MTVHDTSELLRDKNVSGNSYLRGRQQFSNRRHGREHRDEQFRNHRNEYRHTLFYSDLVKRMIFACMDINKRRQKTWTRA